MNHDRYNMQETPESADERKDAKSAAYEREIDRADYLRDEMSDREMEAAMERDEIKARTLASHRPPRFFRETTTGFTWEFRNGKMTTDGEDSIFKSPTEILECLDVIEVDENGDVLELSAEDIAAARGDREQQAESDES